MSRSSVVFLFGAALSIFACTEAPGSAAMPESELQQPFLDEHNAVRAQATPAPAPPLPPLTWSSSLAATAQAHANTCVFEHSTNSLGENLYFFSCPNGFEGACDPDGDLGSTPADAVRGWASEAQFYDYATNTCDAGEVCGHYTQIVWRDTREVGCAASTCLIDGINGVYWVCNYDPAGNVIDELPY